MASRVPSFLDSRWTELVIPLEWAPSPGDGHRGIFEIYFWDRMGESGEGFERLSLMAKVLTQSLIFCESLVNSRLYLMNSKLGARAVDFVLGLKFAVL